eukprot:sb/3476916/
MNSTTTHFRVFMTVDPRYGELSRPMRNRGVELWVDKMEPSVCERPLLHVENCNLFNMAQLLPTISRYPPFERERAEIRVVCEKEKDREGDKAPNWIRNNHFIKAKGFSSVTSP